MDAVESPNAPDTHMQNEAPTIQSCLNGENGTSMHNVLTEDDYRKVKKDLEKCKGKQRPSWGDMETANFKLKFATANTINKEFTRNELVCILHLLATLLGDGSSIPQVTRKPHTHPRASEPCVQNAYPTTTQKRYLTFCEYEWIDEIEHWRTESVQFLHDTSYNYHGQLGWFFKPRVDTTGSIKFYFTDACHILTCLKTKVCTTEIAGLSKKAWEEAAFSADTKLNIALVVECLDKQSVAFAKMVFAADVQDVMRRNGYQKEAYFCQCISDWFAAEDEPGISAIMRCERRLKLRDWLLHGVDFGLYPPYSSYINGIPVITYEALLLQVERKLQMFAVCSKGYNVRATGTQEVEQFFATFRDMDRSGLGTPNSDDIPMIIAKTAEITNCRLDPSRGFHMTTTKASVYPEVIYSDPQGDTVQAVWKRAHSGSPLRICTRDHFFDSEVMFYRKTKSHVR